VSRDGQQSAPSARALSASVPHTKTNTHTKLQTTHTLSPPPLFISPTHRFSPHCANPNRVIPDAAAQRCCSPQIPAVQPNMAHIRQSRPDSGLGFQARNPQGDPRDSAEYVPRKPLNPTHQRSDPQPIPCTLGPLSSECGTHETVKARFLPVKSFSGIPSWLGSGET